MLDDLWEKVAELKEAMRTRASTKAALKAAFAQLAAAGDGAGPSAPPAGQETTAPAAASVVSTLKHPGIVARTGCTGQPRLYEDPTP